MDDILEIVRIFELTEKSKNKYNKYPHPGNLSETGKMILREPYTRQRRKTVSWNWNLIAVNGLP
jgi:hypothetical protein